LQRGASELGKPLLFFLLEVFEVQAQKRKASKMAIRVAESAVVVMKRVTNVERRAGR
jgi:hypothetical protein